MPLTEQKNFSRRTSGIAWPSSASGAGNSPNAPSRVAATSHEPKPTDPLSLQKRVAAALDEPVEGSGGTCYGDSGGPHFFRDETSNLLVSITVTGDVLCRATDKAYRLDTQEVHDFLSQFGVPLPRRTQAGGRRVLAARSRTPR